MKQRKKVHDDWETPEYLLKMIEAEFGECFDPCPLNHNTEDWDGLKMEWKSINFINPPYDLKLKTEFVKKAIFEASQGKTCILLLPSATETKLFVELWNYAHEIRFLIKRVKFKGYNTKGEYVTDSTGQSGSMLVILKGQRRFCSPQVSIILHKE